MNIWQLLTFIPSRILAVSLGLTVLPVRILLEYLVLVPFIVGSSFLFALGIPSLMTYALISGGIRIIPTLVLTFAVIIPLTVIVLTIGLALVIPALVFSVVYDIFKNVWQGVKAGLLQGLEGFRQRYNLLEYYGLEFFVAQASRLRPLSEGEFDNNEINLSTLVDVEVTHYPGMDQEHHKTVQNVLDEPEVQAVNELLAEFRQIEIPVSPTIKTQFAQLQSKLDQYIELEEKLQNVQDKLSAGALEGIEDQLVYGLDVTIPIVVVKQYQEDEQWKTVPTITHISDYDNFKHWLTNSPLHPLTKDNFKEPPNYNECKTRYIWYKLTADYCYAPELGECADLVRALMEKLPDLLVQAKQAVPTRVGSASPSLFTPNSAVGTPDETPATEPRP